MDSRMLTSPSGEHVEITGRQETVCPITAALNLVRLPPVMALSCGSAEIAVGLVDGPVHTAHPDLENAGIHDISTGHEYAGREAAALTRHPAVIPVVAYDARGRPSASTNLGASLGRRGIGAPGEQVTSLSPDGSSGTLAGTSAAAAFVTGALALLWSLFPSAGAGQIKNALRLSVPQRRRTIVPPLLSVAAAHRFLRDTTTSSVVI